MIPCDVLTLIFPNASVISSTALDSIDSSEPIDDDKSVVLSSKSSDALWLEDVPSIKSCNLLMIVSVLVLISVTVPVIEFISV